MTVMLVMVVAILAARLAGALGVDAVASWLDATRVGLATMFAFTGVAHFTRTRGDLVRMVPRSLPAPGLLVTVTGLLEIAGALGLLLPALRVPAAWCLALLLVAMFPANVVAARESLPIAGRAATPLAIRLPMQLVWIALLVWVAVGAG